MRKVVTCTLVSVDGVAEDPDQFLFDFDKVMEANLAEVIGTQDTVLLGRKIYDEWWGQEVVSVRLEASPIGRLTSS